MSIKKDKSKLLIDINIGNSKIKLWANKEQSIIECTLEVE